MMHRLLLASICLFAWGFADALAARLDTVQVHSDAMGTALTALVVVPDAPGPHPVLYLLHGYGGGAFDWQNNTDLRPLADRFGVIIVCPDGSAGSWYLDSPERPSSRFETFVGRELPAWIDQHYDTRAERGGRGITGLSMGGHGALYLALRRPDFYVAAASMSGGLDLRHDTTRWQLADHLGNYHAYPERWADHSVSTLLLRARPNGLPALLLDCGIDDFFLDEHRLVREILLQRGIPHEYVERPGAHTWAYWVRVLPYHLQFFRDHFDAAQG